MAILSSSTLRLSLATVLALLVALASAGGGPASAADFVVTKPADTADGTCDADCSLREAIIAANAAPGADTVTLPAGTYTLSIVGTGEDAADDGDLDITDDLTITGAGAGTTIIDGNGVETGERVFHTDPTGAGITVGISGVTIQGGDDSSGFGGGGALSVGGTLTLTNSVLSGNTVTQAGGALRGIGSAVLTLDGVTVSGNTAHTGMIDSQGSLTVTDSTIDGNTASVHAGGVSNTGALTMTNVTVSNNSAGLSGGGILNGGKLTLTNVTISGNTAGGDGGGIANAGTATLTNSTVSGNTATAGGGIYSTISNNTTTAGGGGVYSGFPVGEVTITNTPVGEVTIKNTIIANNTSGGDCSGTITSNGNNLDSDGTCGLSGTGDLPNTDPKLGALADNGGPTQTHALLSDSPAIDAGNNTDCPATDQRGVARPVDGDVDGTATCDIGAYEYEPPAATPTPTPTPTPAPADLPPTGGDPASGGDAPTVAILLLVAGALGLAGVGSALAGRRQRR